MSQPEVSAVVLTVAEGERLRAALDVYASRAAAASSLASEATARGDLVDATRHRAAADTWRAASRELQRIHGLVQ